MKKIMLVINNGAKEFFAGPLRIQPERSFLTPTEGHAIFGGERFVAAPKVMNPYPLDGTYEFTAARPVPVDIPATQLTQR